VTAPSERSANNRLKGTLITLAGVLVLTPDGLLVRLADLEPFTLAILRGLGQALGIALVALLLYRGRTLQAFAQGGKAGLLLAVIYGIGNLLFILALDLTAVANVLVCLAVMPLIAALVGRAILAEILPRRTWLAIALAFCGVLIVASGSLGAGRFLGDLAALAAAACFGLFFVLVRRYSHVDMIPVVGISGITSAAFALPFFLIYGSGMEAFTAIGGVQWIWIALMGLLVVPISFACIATGPRYIPAAEVALLMLLEMVLGPLWVWLAIGEAPPAPTFYGGALILATLIAHEIVGLRKPGRAG